MSDQSATACALRADIATAAPGSFCIFAGGGLKGQGGFFFQRNIESFYRSDVSKRLGGGTKPAILDFDIGRAMLELAEKTGAFTHGNHSVEQPMTADSEKAGLINNALRNALLTEATLSSACGGSAVLMAQPFVLVDSLGQIHGRPDMVAFAKDHPVVAAYVKTIQRSKGSSSSDHV